MSSETPEGRPYRSARRAEAAEDTRARILDAAMRLFVGKGYGNVTVNDIAREAAVAVPTVYASAGGKTAILATIIDEAVRDPVVDATLAGVRRAGDAREAIRVLVHGVRLDNERYHDIIRVNRTAAAVDENAMEILVRSDRIYRQALADVLPRLRELAPLRDDLTDQHAADLLWFYLGHQSWLTFVVELGWTWDEVEKWLRTRVETAVLKPG